MGLRVGAMRTFLSNSSTLAARSFMVSQAVGFALYVGLIRMFPLYLERQYGLTESEVLVFWPSVLTTAILVGGATRIPMAFVIDRFGRKASVLLAFVVSISITFLVSTTQNPYLIAVMFAILRTTTHLYPLTARSVVADNPEYKGELNGILGSMSRIGSLIGNSAFGLALTLYFPRMMIYWAIGLGIGGIVLFLAFYVPSPESSVNMRNQSREKRNQAYTALLQQLFTSKSGLLALIYLTNGAIMGLTASIQSLFAEHQLGLNPASIGGLVSLSELAFITASPLVGLLLSRTRDARPFLGLGLLTLSIVNLSVALDPTLITFTLFLVGNAIATALIFTSAVTYLTSVYTKGFAFIFAVLTSAFFVGQSILNLVGASLYDHSPVSPFFWGAVTALACFLLVLFVRLPLGNVEETAALGTPQAT